MDEWQGAVKRYLYAQDVAERGRAVGAAHDGEEGAAEVLLLADDEGLDQVGVDAVGEERLERVDRRLVDKLQVARKVDDLRGVVAERHFSRLFLFLLFFELSFSTNIEKEENLRA